MVASIIAHELLIEMRPTSWPPTKMDRPQAAGDLERADRKRANLRSVRRSGCCDFSVQTLQHRQWVGRLGDRASYHKVVCPICNRLTRRSDPLLVIHRSI